MEDFPSRCRLRDRPSLRRPGRYPRSAGAWRVHARCL